MSNEHLGECAMNCRAYAKALHYKEEEFRQGPTSRILASLIRYVCTRTKLLVLIRTYMNVSLLPLHIHYSINNKLQQPDAATGVLEYARKHVQADLVSSIYLLRHSYT